jgi:flagellar motor component MotA
MLHRESTNGAEVQALVGTSVGVSEADSVVHPLTQRLQLSNSATHEHVQGTI